MKLQTVWTLSVGIFAAIGGLSGVIFVIRTLFPTFFKKNVDPYFERFAPTVAEIDDKIDALLLRLPDTKLRGILETIDGFTEYLQKELQEMGYKLTPEDSKKVANRVEAQLVRKEGITLTRLQEGGFKIDVATKF